jgi:RhoGAP domain
MLTLHALDSSRVFSFLPFPHACVHSRREDVILLREAINKCEVIVDIAESTNPLLIAHVFKDYLKELPSPLIPRDFIPILQECMGTHSPPAVTG